jgi:hypothetical protein
LEGDYQGLESDDGTFRDDHDDQTEG